MREPQPFPSHPPITCLLQTVSINKAINAQEVAVKEKHARNILLKAGRGTRSVGAGLGLPGKGAASSGEVPRVLGRLGAINNTGYFSRMARRPCCCHSLSILIGAQAGAPGTAIPGEGRRRRCPQQVGTLPPKVDPQHPSQAPGKRHSPSLACASGAPRAGLGGEGGLCHFGDSICLGWASLAPCGGLASLGSVGAAVFGWPCSITKGECFLDCQHRASWALTMRREHRPSGQW